MHIRSILPSADRHPSFAMRGEMPVRLEEVFNHMPQKTEKEFYKKNFYHETERGNMKGYVGVEGGGRKEANMPTTISMSRHPNDGRGENYASKTNNKKTRRLFFLFFTRIIV